jgi:hypothetical protein
MLISKFSLAHFEELNAKIKNKQDMNEKNWTNLLEYKYPDLKQDKKDKMMDKK